MGDKSGRETPRRASVSHDVDQGEPPVEAGPGWAVRPHFWITLDRDDLPGPVRIEVRVIDAKPECVSVEVRRRAGRAIGRNDLRAIPIHTLMKAAVAQRRFRVPKSMDLFDAEMWWTLGSYHAPGKPHPHLNLMEASIDWLERSQRRGRKPVSPEVQQRIRELWPGVAGEPKPDEKISDRLKGEGFEAPSRTSIYKYREQEGER